MLMFIEYALYEFCIIIIIIIIKYYSKVLKIAI
jgi:hypothetical protein